MHETNFNPKNLYRIGGIVLKPLGMGILIPGIGALLGIAGTLGSAVWYLLLSRTFFQMGWGNANENIGTARSPGWNAP